MQYNKKETQKSQVVGGFMAAKTRDCNGFSGYINHILSTAFVIVLCIENGCCFCLFVEESPHHITSTTWPNHNNTKSIQLKHCMQNYLQKLDKEKQGEWNLFVCSCDCLIVKWNKQRKAIALGLGLANENKQVEWVCEMPTSFRAPQLTQLTQKMKKKWKWQWN